MIPINLGIETGAGFGSSDVLKRIGVYSESNFQYYSKFYSKNPIIYKNDSLFVRMVNILSDYIGLGLDIERYIPQLALNLSLVYRNKKQVLHETEYGNLLIVPEYTKDVDVIQVLYTDATEVNYNQSGLIDTTTIVSINIRRLEDIVKKHIKKGDSIYDLITNEINTPLMRKISDFALYNVLTGIEHYTGGDAPDHRFYMYDLASLIDKNSSAIFRSIRNKDTGPLDVIKALPLHDIKWRVIEDDYIDNLLWINLISYRAFVINGMRINEEKLYRKYLTYYSRWGPRDVNDKFFSVADAKLKSRLEYIGFV